MNLSTILLALVPVTLLFGFLWLVTHAAQLLTLSVPTP